MSIILIYTIIRSITYPIIRNLAYLLSLLLMIQIMLGAYTILLHKNILITTLHVSNGAAILGTSFLIMICMLPKKINKL